MSGRLWPPDLYKAVRDFELQDLTDTIGVSLNLPDEQSLPQPCAWLTFEANMNKKLVRARSMAHIKTGLKNLAHLTRLIPTEFT